jgi:hypothetical protein
MSEVEVKEAAPAESVVNSVEPTTPAPEAAITEVAEKLASKPVEDLSAKELADLKVKIAEYESKLKEVESRYSESEKEASLYRSKAPLLKNVEGLSEEAVAALKNKDVWALLDSAGIEEEHLYNELAKGRPQLSVEEKIRKEIEKIQKAEASKAEREQKAIAEKRKLETMKTLSDWLDLTDVTKVDPSLHDAHEILRAAREEKDLAVEETLISLVEQSNISYAEAVKTLAEVIEKKVMKYTSIKALDSKIASRYKKEDTPAPAAPVDSKAKEVLKTIGDKVEEASKHVDTDSIIDRSSMDLSDVLKSIKEKEKRKASNLRRL